MPAHSSGRYRGRLLHPSEASILATFRGAFVRFVTRLRCFILLLLYVHKHCNTSTRTTFHVEHFALFRSAYHLRPPARPYNLPQPFGGPVPCCLFCLVQGSLLFLQGRADPEGKIRPFDGLDATLGVDLKRLPKDL